MGNYCGALESIDNGITYLVDHSHIMNSPEHADAAVKGLQDANIRAVFCHANYTNPPWEGSCRDKAREASTPDWRVEDAQRIRESLFPSNRQTDLVRFGFAPSEPEITDMGKILHKMESARAMGAAIITAHNSLGKYDAGKLVVRGLEQKNALGPDILLSHGTTLRSDELEAIKKRRVSLSSTPDTELQMGMSYPIAFKARDFGCTASLGVDICSNSPADMFQQMRLLLQSQRYLEHEAGNSPPMSISRQCAEVLEMATMGGAKAVGLENIIGSITPGKRADLIITRCDSPRLVPVHDPIGALVLHANGSDIDTVFIDGRMVKLVGVDWPQVREKLRASAASIMERSKNAPEELLQAARDATVESLSSTS